MQTISIIGAGVSGLAIGQCLKENFQVRLFERNTKPGGLIQCDIVQGNLFHKVGGHVFNTKNQEVSDWFWSFFDRHSEFVQTKRNAKILLKGRMIDYPIENHLYQLDDAIAQNIITDLLQIDQLSSPEESNDLESFLLNNFGRTLYEIYFKPYNTKIWNTDLSMIPMEWLNGKLPMPNAKNILLSNVYRTEENKMVHSTFYYPNEGGGQFIADRLSSHLEIIYNTPISSIERDRDQFIINGEHKSDIVIYTGDIRNLSFMIKTNSIELRTALNSVSHFQSTGTSNLLCECEPNDISWLYLPEHFTTAHRIIYTGNFSALNNRSTSKITCVVEFAGSVDYKTMASEAKKMPGLLNVLDYNYEPNSYVIQTHDSRAKILRLKQLLEPSGLFILGRFAEWEYYNMDKAIEASLTLSKRLQWSIKE